MCPAKGVVAGDECVAWVTRVEHEVPMPRRRAEQSNRSMHRWRQTQYAPHHAAPGVRRYCTTTAASRSCHLAGLRFSKLLVSEASAIAPTTVGLPVTALVAPVATARRGTLAVVARGVHERGVVRVPAEAQLRGKIVQEAGEEGGARLVWREQHDGKRLCERRVAATQRTAHIACSWTHRPRSCLCRGGQLVQRRRWRRDGDCAWDDGCMRHVPHWRNQKEQDYGQGDEQHSRASQQPEWHATRGCKSQCGYVL
mmetsp:Transcript_18487/g.37368  ORF Transcript_18487/g.37368 Transcript_18487/m.37368 type:complete len:254 (+) Transcript_18487:664-1425(+)